MNRNIEIGKWGEKVAESFLKNNACKVVDKNVRTPYGEIDIIAEDEGEVIIVEVKTRTNNKYGYPEESITELKIKHLIDSAEYYFQNMLNDCVSYRLDVITIEGKPGGSSPEINWYKNAIS